PSCSRESRPHPAPQPLAAASLPTQPDARTRTSSLKTAISFQRPTPRQRRAEVPPTFRRRRFQRRCRLIRQLLSPCSRAASTATGLRTWSAATRAAAREFSLFIEPMQRRLLLLIPTSSRGSPKASSPNLFCPTPRSFHCPKRPTFSRPETSTATETWT